MLVVTAALAALAIPAAFGGRSADPGITSTSIHIGGTAPLTGSAQAFQSVAKGAEAYFKYLNSRGGVNKRKITYEYLDDQYIPSETVRQTRVLVQDKKVFAIFNSLGTEHNEAIRPYLNQIQVPQLFVATGATTFGRDHKQYPWTIAYQPTYIAEGAMYGAYIRRTMPKAKIAILYQDDSYGNDLIAGLKRGTRPEGREHRREGGLCGRRRQRAIPDRPVARLERGCADALFDPEVHDPGLPVRERARLEAEDLRQRRFERVEHHDHLLEPRTEQAGRGVDLDRFPEGPERSEVDPVTPASSSTARS